MQVSKLVGLAHTRYIINRVASSEQIRVFFRNYADKRREEFSHFLGEEQVQKKKTALVARCRTSFSGIHCCRSICERFYRDIHLVSKGRNGCQYASVRCGCYPDRHPADRCLHRSFYCQT